MCRTAYQKHNIGRAACAAKPDTNAWQVSHASAQAIEFDVLQGVPCK